MNIAVINELVQPGYTLSTQIKLLAQLCTWLHTNIIDYEQLLQRKHMNLCAP